MYNLRSNLYRFCFLRSYPFFFNSHFVSDYIRTFTWDKRLENMVKTSVMMGNPGKQPTIIQPKDYRERFIAAMKRYFLPVPDRWYGFGSGS